MRGCRGDDFKRAAFPQFAKRGKQIAFVFIDKETPGFAKYFEIKFCEVAELWVIAVPFLFTVSEIDQEVEMPHVAFAKQFVLQHCAERRRDRHGQLERHTLIDQALHHAQQWDVTLGHRLEEPVFFEKMLMFRMTNERKMRVKNERQVSRHRATLDG